MSRFDAVLVFFSKFFVLGLILHFFFHTIFQYGLGLSLPTALLLWKEILVFFLLLVSFCFILFHRKFGFFLQSHSYLIWYIWLFFMLFAWTVYTHFYIHHSLLSAWLLSVKYDLFPFFVFISGVWVSFVLPSSLRSRFLDWFIWILKNVLIVSFVWYVGLHFFPHLLAKLGYSLDAYQREYDIAPPLYYLQHIWTGTIRNQGLFGGPVSWWFFLTAFWPLYFRHFVGWNKKNSMSFVRRWFWILLYLVNVWLCYSRGARLAVVLETLVLLIFYYRRWWRQLLVSGILLVVGVVGLVRWKWPSSLLSRNLSDNGHVDHVVEWLRLVVSSPWVGYGWWTAGPASYRVMGGNFFNPENQYLQIAVEYGVIWLVLWLSLYVLLVSKSVLLSTQRCDDGLLGVARNMLLLGLFGLAVSGMFLHPAVDSQVMYVLLFLFWLYFN